MTTIVSQDRLRRIARTGDPVPRYGAGEIFALHLLPGVVTLAGALALQPLVSARGLPSGMALTLAFLLVHTPLMVLYLLLWGRSHAGSWSLRAAIPYRRALSRPGVAIGLAGALLALLLAIAWSGRGSILADDAFASYPGWLRPSGQAFETSARPAVLVAAWLSLVVDGVVHPIAEELYFRGHLLPALSRMGAVAPLASAMLFAAQHVWQPWNAPLIVIIMLLPTWAVRRSRCVWIGVVMHCGVNLAGGALGLAAHHR